MQFNFNQSVPESYIFCSHTDVKLAFSLERWMELVFFFPQAFIIWDNITWSSDNVIIALRSWNWIHLSSDIKANRILTNSPRQQNPVAVKFSCLRQLVPGRGACSLGTCQLGRSDSCHLNIGVWNQQQPSGRFNLILKTPNDMWFSVYLKSLAVNIHFSKVRKLVSTKSSWKLTC